VKVKKLTAILAALTLIVTLSAAALACGHHRGSCYEGSGSHVCADWDRDGLCDGCGAACAYRGGHGRHGHHGGC